MHIPEHVRAQLERIRAEGEQQIEKLRADAITEALAMAQRLRDSDNDLIPLRLMCEHLALEAMHAEPIARRKHVAHYETARAAVKNAKAAIRAGIITPRDQGAGLPLDLAHWCSEDETLRPIDELMPHSRVMIRRSDARNWCESMGVDVPAFLHCKQTQAAPAQEQPAEIEAPPPPAPKRKGPSETHPQKATHLKKVVFEILNDSRPDPAKAVPAVMKRLRAGECKQRGVWVQEDRGEEVVYWQSDRMLEPKRANRRTIEEHVRDFSRRTSRAIDISRT